MGGGTGGQGASPSQRGEVTVRLSDLSAEELCHSNRSGSPSVRVIGPAGPGLRGWPSAAAAAGLTVRPSETSGRPDRPGRGEPVRLKQEQIW